ncbi:MAG: hypothetical protein U9N62_00030 [Thermotogota bacterium]|nr:hypothetical protein [Thermotogota bacterium]
MKKVFFSFLVLLAFVTIQFSDVTDYIPADSVFAFTSVNNPENYAKLKEQTIFGFLLRDMGLEGMLSQQVESMKYADPEFKPENVWALLQGDIGLFVRGEINYDVLAQMDEIADPEQMMAMDPMASLGPLMEAIEDLNFALILKLTANPKDILETMGKLLQMELQFGANGPVVLAEDNGHLLITMDQESMDVAMKAKANNIMTNSVFSNLYQEDNWMIFYNGKMDNQKMMEAMEKAYGMELEFDLSEKVEMEYGWTKGYVNNGLVLETFNQYTYKDQAFKDMIINMGNRQSDLIEKLNIPGFVRGALVLRNMDQLRTMLDPVIRNIMTQAAKMSDEEIPAEAMDMIMTLMESWTGDMRLSLDVSMTEAGEMAVDMYADLGTSDMAYIEQMIQSSSEQLQSSNGMKYMKLSGKMEDMTETDPYMEEFGTGEFDPYLVLSQNKMMITTLKPENIQTKLAQATPITSNQMFTNMSSEFKTVDKYYGILFVDISDILTKLMGMAYPSAIYSEVGVNNEGDSQAVFVIK